MGRGVRADRCVRPYGLVRCVGRDSDPTFAQADTDRGRCARAGAQRGLGATELVGRLSPHRPPAGTLQGRAVISPLRPDVALRRPGCRSPQPARRATGLSPLSSASGRGHAIYQRKRPARRWEGAVVVARLWPTDQSAPARRTDGIRRGGTPVGSTSRVRSFRSSALVMLARCG